MSRLHAIQNRRAHHGQCMPRRWRGAVVRSAVVRSAAVRSAVVRWTHVARRAARARCVALFGTLVAATVWLWPQPAFAALDFEAAALPAPPHWIDAVPRPMAPHATDGGDEGSGIVPKVVPAPVMENPVQFSSEPPPAEHKRMVRMVLREAGRHRLDPRLVLAVMQVESRFDSQARSPRNAQGLMQLMPDTAKRFQVQDPSDPLQNLRGGMRYLRWLLDYYHGDVVLALAAYNSGEGSVDRHKGVPPFRETVAYVQRIRALYPFDRHPFEAPKNAGASRAWVTASVNAPVADASRLQ
jgi:soluble lytic murein transglycosylase-like protein